MKGIIDSLAKSRDKLLSIREKVGAELVRVFILTRSWSGGRPNDGELHEELEEIRPTPGVKDFSHDVRLQEGAGVQQGDIVLRSISKSTFQTEEPLDTRTEEHGVEKYYLLLNRQNEQKFYTVVSIREKHLSWNVQIRRVSNEDELYQKGLKWL